MKKFFSMCLLAVTLLFSATLMVACNDPSEEVVLYRLTSVFISSDSAVSDDVEVGSVSVTSSGDSVYNNLSALYSGTNLEGKLSEIFYAEINEVKTLKGFGADKKQVRLRVCASLETANVATTYEDFDKTTTYSLVDEGNGRFSVEFIVFYAGSNQSTEYGNVTCKLNFLLVEND